MHLVPGVALESSPMITQLMKLPTPEASALSIETGLRVSVNGLCVLLKCINTCRCEPSVMEWSVSSKLISSPV